MERIFERSTRKCSNLSDMKPEILGSIRHAIEIDELEDVESQVLEVYETTSVPVKKRKVKEKDVQFTGIFVTPEFVFWSTLTGGEVSTAWARLATLQVSDYRKSEDFKIIPDNGINVFGFVREAPERGIAFIGLGEEPAGESLRNTLGEAVEKAGGIWKR